VAYLLLAASALAGVFARTPILRKLGNLFALSAGLWTILAAFQVPSVSGLEARVRLAAVFAVGIATMLASLHALSYASQWDGGRRAAVMGVAFPVFIAAMLGVLESQGLVEFLVAWEVMTIASAVLVVIDHEEPENRSAVVLYLAIAHVSPVAFLLAVGVLGPHSLSWESIAQAASLAHPTTRIVALALVLTGAAAKSGLFPLHSWLPRAHPAAPSLVSAVMSGSMVVLGAWTLTRIGPDLLGHVPPWWGWVVAGVGALSALIGALHALVEGDLKRLLAYSTVENMGLLFLEIGVYMAATTAHADAVASLALGALVVHILAHAVAKSTLFLAAGSLIGASGTRVINRMGGLLRAAPTSSAGFIVAAASVTALPPFAGFVGEWLLMRSLMGVTGRTTGALGLMVALAVGIVALTAGLAVAAFAKAVGIALLGTARHDSAHRHPVGAPEKIAALLGAAGVTFAPFVTAMLPHWSLVPSSAHAVSGETSMIALGLAVAAALLWLATRGRAAKVRRTDAWACGLPGLTTRNQYTADSFSQPLARVFAGVLNPSVDIDIDVHPEIPHAVRSRTYTRSSSPLFARALGARLFGVLRVVSRRVAALQSGRVSTYATWTVVAAVFLLLYAGWVR
jgi:formate hydrogenlyase subunit 3/multisubunit Na+/H+ antiporter MnhD subunit